LNDLVIFVARASFEELSRRREDVDWRTSEQSHYTKGTRSMIRLNSSLVALLTPLLAISIAYACTPKDASKDDGMGGQGGNASTSGGTAGKDSTGGSTESNAGSAGAADEAGAPNGLEGGAGGQTHGGDAGDAGSGGMAGGDSTCGALGQACCGSSCDEQLVCLGTATCSCAQALFGGYVLRGDGKLYGQGTATSATTGNGMGVARSLNVDARVAILNADTGFALTDVTDVQDGLYHGCAVAAGSAWCWAVGAAIGNSYGQLGKGTTDTNSALYGASRVLKAVNQPLQNVVAIGGGWSNTACAVTHEGQLYCWGDLQWAVNGGTKLSSGYAQLITTDGSAPLSGVLQAAVGASHVCAIVQAVSNRELWCWGENATFNNLGLGDSTNRQYPTKVLGLSNPSQVVIADYNEQESGATCALDGGAVKCWGVNSYGATGNGDANTLRVLHPTPVVNASSTALDGVTALQSALQSFCALRADHSLWCWGSSAGSPSAIKSGVSNVVAIGSAKEPRFLSDDGVYHFGATSRTPYCGSL